MGSAWSRGTAGSGLCAIEELCRGTAGTPGSPAAVAEGPVGHLLPVLCPGRYSCGSLGTAGMRVWCCWGTCSRVA